MSNEQLLETWNRTFGFKIHAGDLQAPTEEFVINALLQILDSINIDINVIKEEIFSTNQDLVEQGKICLFQYVNRFYKKLTINSNKKRSFLYGDLIQPTPKRTTHVLQTLLNYVLYYSMTEEEILSNTQSVIEKYQELVNKKAKLLAEQEQNKALAADQKLKLDSYTKDLEEITKRNESLKSLPVLSEFEDNKEKKVRLIQKKGNIMINIEDLKSKVINVEKIADMEGTILEIQEKIEEKQTEIEKMNYDHEQLSMDIASIEKLNSLLKGVLDLVLEAKIPKQTDISQLKNDLIKYKNEFEANQNRIADLKTKVEDLQTNVNLIKKTKSELTENWRQKFFVIEESIKQLRIEEENQLMAVQNVFHLIDDSLLQKNEMIQNANAAIEIIRKSLIKDIEI